MNIYCERNIAYWCILIAFTIEMAKYNMLFIMWNMHMYYIQINFSLFVQLRSLF